MASLDLFIKDRMKVKFKQRSSSARTSGRAQPKKASKSTKTTKSTKATGRYIPNPIKREVAVRDDFQCTFTSKSGHRCNEKQGLEYHHLQAFALGGEHTLQTSQHLELDRHVEGMGYSFLLRVKEVRVG